MRALIILLLISSAANARAVRVDPLERHMMKPGPRPMPPPPFDPTAQFRRQIMLALAGAEASVQACADRFGSFADDVDVRVTTSKYGLDVRVARAGGVRFQRCVNTVVRNALGFASGRKIMMTVGYTFRLDRDVEEDGGFSRPPP